MSAIPCLNYRRALKEEKELKESIEDDTLKPETNEDRTHKSAEESEPASGCPYANGESSNGKDEATMTATETNNDESNETPPPAKRTRIFGGFSNAKIETVNENLKAQSLTVEQINEYCKNLFVFKNIRVMRFT